MVWDGECTFCYFWVERWKQITGNKIDYQRLKVASPSFPDIDKKAFKQAVRFIDTDGFIYSGAAAAFKSFEIAGQHTYWWKLYHQSSRFRLLCNTTYRWIARNRSFMFKLTKIFFGPHPHNMKPYWVFYLVFMISLLTFFIVLIS